MDADAGSTNCIGSLMIDNTKAHQSMNEWIRGLRAMPAMVKAAPAELVPTVKQECDASISAGQSLDGVRWAPRKEDGTQALQGAQKDLTVTASSNVIWVKIKNGLVWSQWGTKHQRKREILPTKGLPRKLGLAIKKGVIEMAPEFLNRKGSHRATKGIKWA